MFFPFLSHTRQSIQLLYHSTSATFPPPELRYFSFGVHAEWCAGGIIGIAGAVPVLVLRFRTKKFLYICNRWRPIAGDLGPFGVEFLLVGQGVFEGFWMNRVRPERIDVCSTGRTFVHRRLQGGLLLARDGNRTQWGKSLERSS